MAFGLVPPSFHGITAVAELKANRNMLFLSFATAFPRHHSRGRIEGRRPTPCPPRPSSCFHGITAVAELKEGRWGSRTRSIYRVSTASQPWPT